MNLTEFANQYVREGIGAPLHTVGPASGLLLESIGNEEITAPTIGTIFWQAFIYSRAFERLIIKLFTGSNIFRGDVRPASGLVREYINFFRHYPLKNPFIRYFLQRESFQGPPLMVLRHGTSYWPRYDLVLFLPEFRKFRISEPIIVDRVDVSPSEIFEGWDTFVHRFPWPSRRLESEDLRVPLENLGPPSPVPPGDIDIITTYGAAAAIEAYGAQPFGVLLVPPPETIQLSASVKTVSYPSPAIPISLTQGGPSVASVGVVARNKQGIIGVTTARHALPKRGKTEVWVGDLKGTIISRDIWSDSCFIEVPGVPTTSIQPLNGPLEKVPRNRDDVYFEGVISRRKDTLVTGWDPRLPRCEKNSQCVVTTEPDTNPGDSGAALIDTDNKIVGFAYSRTGFGEKIEFATWMWARSVLDFHGLR